MPEGLHIEFIGADPDLAGTYAQELSNELRDEVPGVDIKRIREDPRSQDPGTIVAIVTAVLSSATVTSIGHGIALWLARHSGVKLRFKTADGELVAENVDSRNAPEMISAAVRGGLKGG
jgi:hypothetical protein